MKHGIPEHLCSSNPIGGVKVIDAYRQLNSHLLMSNDYVAFESIRWYMKPTSDGRIGFTVCLVNNIRDQTLSLLITPDFVGWLMES